MMRFARVIIMLLAVGLCRAATVHAQVATSTAPSKFYLAVDVGPTFGHASDVFIGGEGGWRWRDMWDVVLEGGHIGNAATSDFDQRAQAIAAEVGATASAVQKVNFVDLGLRYHSPVWEKWDGYVLLAGGLAQVNNQTVFSVNGTAVPPESLGIAVGSDLSGTVRVGIVTIGAGVRRDFSQRYFMDLSYRFGRTFQKTDEDDQVVVPGLNTQRLQVGVGIRF